MEPEINDALPESSTGVDENQSAESSNAEQPEPKSSRQQLRDDLAAKKKAAEKSNDDGKKTAKAVDDKKAGDAKAQGEKVDEAKGDEGKTIPLTAFKARLAEETKKRKALSEKLDASDLRAKKLEAALEIAAQEIQREREARAKGVAFDEKDAKIREFELSKTAREKAEAIAQQAVAARQQAEQAEQHGEVVTQLRADVNDAVTKNKFVTREALITALRDPRNNSRSVAEVAAEINAIKREEFKGEFVKDGASFPKTVKPRAGGSHAPRVELTRKSLNERFQQLKAQQSA